MPFEESDLFFNSLLKNKLNEQIYSQITDMLEKKEGEITTTDLKESFIEKIEKLNDDCYLIDLIVENYNILN